MTLNIASLNVRGLKDPSKCANLLGECSNLCVNVPAVQETHFISTEDCQVLESNFVVFSAFGSRCSGGISCQVGHSLNAMVDLVFASDGGQLVGADVTIKSFDFQVVAVYASKNVDERHSYFQWFGPFIADSIWLVLMGDWNAILDPKLDKGGWGARGSDKCESSLTDFLAEHDLVDWFHLDHPGWEMWMWIDLPPFFRNVITPLIMLPGMAPWANKWLNISFRIGMFGRT